MAQSMVCPVIQPAASDTSPDASWAVSAGRPHRAASGIRDATNTRSASSAYPVSSGPGFTQFTAPRRMTCPREGGRHSLQRGLGHERRGFQRHGVLLHTRGEEHDSAYRHSGCGLDQQHGRPSVHRERGIDFLGGDKEEVRRARSGVDCDERVQAAVGSDVLLYQPGGYSRVAQIRCGSTVCGKTFRDRPANSNLLADSGDQGARHLRSLQDGWPARPSDHSVIGPDDGSSTADPSRLTARGQEAGVEPTWQPG